MTTKWKFDTKDALYFKIENNWVMYATPIESSYRGEMGKRDKASEEWATDGFDTHEELNEFLERIGKMFKVDLEVITVGEKMPMTVIAVKA